MRKFLVVGCGGSGDATLSYMMDQIKSELALHGIDHIPAGWQFVEVDVPVSPVATAPGLGNIREQGGTYFGSGAVGIGYSVLDNGVSQTLQQKNALDSIATWAPRKPEDVVVAISAGAGQYRAVGRMIALSKAAGIRQALENAWNQLSRVETNSEMASLNMPGLGRFDPEDPPLVIVVSSMAGGAGASMALDVCRLLTLIPGVDPRLMGIFMVSADIFENLPEAARTGVRANSLAMLGEIVATQSGAARKHDVATLSALGQQNGQGARIPFQRVFPVGRFVGAQRTLFGDGSPQAVYRGLGRGLAALMMSGKATEQFERYDLANAGSPAGNRDYLGWGEDWDPLPWGSFGYSSLSMGRERYREYSAQRIARTSVDRILHGHVQQGNVAPETQQVERLLSSQWAHIVTQLGLPGGDGGVIAAPQMFSWFVDTAFRRDEVEKTARNLVESQLASYLPSPAGIQITQWLPAVRQRLNERRSAFATGVGQAAHQWAFTWQKDFTDRLVTVIEAAIATFGVAYATALLDRLEAHLGNAVLKGLHELSIRGPQDVGAIPQGFESKVSGMKGVVANGQDVLDQLTAGFRGVFRDSLYAQAAGLAEQVLAGSVAGLIAPLKASISEGHKILERAESAVDEHAGLAHLASDLYRSWPSDGDQAVPTRFDVANNEVLLTKSAEFPAQYEGDIQAAVENAAGEASSFVGARGSVVSQVISGQWKTTGGTQAPGGLVSQESPWRSPVFATNPFTNDVQVPSEARFTLHVTPHEVVSRARQFVGRPGESFDKFCSLSLRDFVSGKGVEASQVELRQREVAKKFREALTLARPLISVNTEAVTAIHGTPMKYRYKFSELPFDLIPGVADSLVEAVTGDPAIDSSSLQILQNSMTADEGVTRVDIFGSYQNYSPLVFDSVLEPVAQQWASTPAMGRKDFWRWRRSRPLTAALPMGDVERRAMVLGWFVGQLVGQIRIPESPFTSAVEIWDPAASRWVDFPNPLLTAPAHFLASYDWLPAVLESVLVAMARSHEAPVMESLKPYQLLRSIYDATSQEPATGIIEANAKVTVTNWLRSGETGTGANSRVPGLVPAQSVAERAELARVWLGGIKTLAGVEFLAPGVQGAQGGGTFSSIPSRSHAAVTPIFHDLAEDVFAAMNTLIELVVEAEEDALRAPAPASAQAPAAPNVTVAMPEGGVF